MHPRVRNTCTKPAQTPPEKLQNLPRPRSTLARAPVDTLMQVFA
jgi:hypothetical protein